MAMGASKKSIFQRTMDEKTGSNTLK